MRANRCSLLWVALSAALLAACGGGGGDERSDATAGAAPAGAAPANPGAATPSAPADPGSGGGSEAPPPAADITCGLAGFETEALARVNQYRAAGASCGSRGVFAAAPAMALNSRLTAAAYGHSRDMADNDYFSHTSLDGRTMVDRVNATGYAWSLLGENIAAGYGSVQNVVAGWMASDGHCANLMNPQFTEFGLACARNSGSRYGDYWTQNLGRP